MQCKNLGRHNLLLRLGGLKPQRTVLDARRELMFERRYRWDRTDQIVQQVHTDATPTTH
ncbi:hypothetical protein HF650_00440 [Kosakonia sp. SMBL-WEM22]|nr:hypothetical protein HF650_00440 [Kosakonia sp. SMBL-WEM22]